jgi:glycosyltransferase involved in cell wall biosynthesis
MVISNFGSHNLITIFGTVFKVVNNVHFIHTTSMQTSIDSRYNGVYQNFLFLRKKTILANNSLIMTNSTGTKLDTMKRFNIPVEKIKVFNYLIKDEFFKARKIKNQICIVGRLDRSKGHLKLLNEFNKTLNSFPDLKLIIIGDGETKADIVKFIKDKKIHDNVFLKGKLKRDEVNLYLAESVLSISASSSEAFGLVIIESLMFGTPVIATKTEGSLSILESGVSGEFFNFHETGSFQVACQTVIENHFIYSDNARQTYLSKYSSNLAQNHVERLITYTKVDL